MFALKLRLTTQVKRMDPNFQGQPSFGLAPRKQTQVLNAKGHQEGDDLLEDTTAQTDLTVLQNS